MSKAELSIIIVSYNTKKITSDCLLSVINNTNDLDYEILVVDNGSVDGSVETIEDLSKKYSQIHLIDAGENLGFGKANNLAVKKAKGKYLLFLNSDVVVFDNAIKISLDNYKNHPGTGVYSCRLLNANKSIQPSGGFFPNLLNVFAWQLFIDDIPLLGQLFHSFHPQKSTYQKNRQVDWVTGAFMIISKEIFNKVNGFDEHIFMYTEEMELCYRLHHLGFGVVYQATPSVIHLGGASSGSSFAITSEVKYMIYFWQKHKPKWQLPFVRLFFFIGSLLRIILFGIIKGNKVALQTYVKALKLSL